MIGIVTYHFAHNYGAMLQAYALKTYLSETGEKAEIINYCPQRIKVQYSIGKDTINLKNFLWKVRQNRIRKKQYHLFEKFKKEKLTDFRDEVLPEELSSISKRFTALVVGSDQVWNTDINFEDQNYFLEFVENDVKKYGYSISLGSVKMSKKMREFTDKNIDLFDRISFREKSACDFFDELYHKRYPLTCDPVFLIEKEKWRSIKKKPNSRIPDKYILYYSLHDDKSLKDSVIETSKRENIPIVSIHPLCNKIKFSDFNLTDVGPEEFLWLVDNAEYVASNSFHANAFSIIFCKRAIIRPHPVLGDRNNDLLSLVSDSKKRETKDIYDFSIANRDALDKLIKFSKGFLDFNGTNSFKPINTENDESHSIVMGVKAKDSEKRLSSQSGGVATVIAERFIDMGAVVYGCALNENLDAVYLRVTERKNLSLLKGSKYVRAYLNNTFSDVKKDIENNKLVLFIGHLCNVAGLLKYVSDIPQKENLYTMDFICHGTPSHEVYKEYLKWVETRENKKILSFNFRYKDSSTKWSEPWERIVFDDESQFITRDYTNLFYSNLALRPCCSTCKYATYKRVSDFTVADYWGVEKYHPSFYDEIGVSLVMLNSVKAKGFKQTIIEKCDTVSSDIQKSQQPNTIAPTPLPTYSESFWRELKKNGFEPALKRFTQYGGFWFKIRRKLYNYTGRWY